MPRLNRSQALMAASLVGVVVLGVGGAFANAALLDHATTKPVSWVAPAPTEPQVVYQDVYDYVTTPQPPTTSAPAVPSPAASTTTPQPATTTSPVPGPSLRQPASTTPPASTPTPTVTTPHDRYDDQDDAEGNQTERGEREAPEREDDDD